MLLGVTGCSGTGVSTVTSVWKGMGAEVCSLDNVGHRFLDKKAVKISLEGELGIPGLAEKTQEQIREELRERAFVSPEILSGINRVLHPRLSRWVADSAELLRGRRGVFVLDAALIFELGLENCFNFVITVTDDMERVVNRLVERDGISIDTVVGRWKNQLSINEKRNRSHFVISNSETESILKKKAENFYKSVIQRMEEFRGTQDQTKVN